MGDRVPATGRALQTDLAELRAAVLELAAAAIALGDPATHPAEHRKAAEEVLIEAGLLQPTDNGVLPDPESAGLSEAETRRLGSQAAASIVRAAAALSGANAWQAQDDDALIAHGRAAGQGATAFKSLALPAMPGLAEMLGSTSAAMLDVGVGVAEGAVSFCETFPALHVVGIDVFPRALELARRAVADAGMTERIELRHQDIAELTDHDRYALAWLPAPFIPGNAIEAGLPRIVHALVPGGWVMVLLGRVDDGLEGALRRFQTIAFGGSILSEVEAQGLLRTAGFVDVSRLPTSEGMPTFMVGRRPGEA